MPVLTRAASKWKRSWASLPAEIRLMILEVIIDEKPLGWGSWASVCKEWQPVIEKENFRWLKFRGASLDCFETAVGQNERRRLLIRHIEFKVELPIYSCHLCGIDESTFWSVGKGLTIGNGIRDLFRILSAPESGPEPRRREVTLELHAFQPPSKWADWFNICYITPRHAVNEDIDDNCGIARHRHDLLHRKFLPGTTLEGIFRGVGLRFENDLPQLNISTGLVVRLHLRCLLKLVLLILFTKQVLGHGTYHLQATVVMGGPAESDQQPCFKDW
ncbi:hypothetical protein F5144DRAFT_362167 [Chaetomium tenue]|uniref:Uncharacterized protein n=1 Tax=Chaetomium tenue TaxID=1854479 RepID=A0ACB7NZ42_9PEZI|nr:hypothetical protein F5144DRAFT_362167 [Chaetomium globosum]